MSQRSEIVGIQYLRGFCAIAVVIAHTSQMAEFPKYFGGTVLGGVLAHGGAGVDIFFVISGFIITVVALQGETLTPSLSRASFFAKRFARIVPLMWLSIAAFLVLRMAATSTEIIPLSYMQAAFLIPYGDVQPNSIWTLRHEAIFYIVFAVSFLGPKSLRWIMWAWLASSIIIPIATLGLLADMDDATPVGIIFSPVNIEFAAGMLVGFAWLKRPQAADLWLRIDPFLLLMLLSALVMAWVAVSGTNRSVPGMAGLAVVGGGLIWLAARLRCPSGPIASAGRLLGNASYAIYLFHPPLVAASLVAGSRLAPDHVAIAIPVIVALVTTAGVVIHLVVEKPLVRHVQRWLSPKPAMPPIVVRGV